MVFAGWRGASGKPHPPDSGGFFLLYQVIALLVAGLLFIAFKCLRERAVTALSLLIPVSALLFAALPRLASFHLVHIPCLVRCALYTTSDLGNLRGYFSVPRESLPAIM
jgi:hypothetical protein